MKSLISPSFWTAWTVGLGLATLASAQAQLALIRQGFESRGAYEIGDALGSAVCAGDFNGDGFEDLAAGSPAEKIDSGEEAGFVTINYGSAHGLSWTGTQGLRPSDGGLSDALAHRMGAALASADFNGDGFADLAVGLPASAVNGNEGAGRVLIFVGSGTGLAQTPALVLNQTPFGGANEALDRFGSSLATGRLGSDDRPDLVIGGPGENGTDAGSSIGDGAVFLIRSGPGGLDPAQASFISAAQAEAPRDAEFGQALALGNLSGSAEAELVVGAPRALGPDSAWLGQIWIFPGTGSSVTLTGKVALTNLDGGLALPTSLTLFGSSLAIGDFFGDDGTLDLAVGAVLSSVANVTIFRGTVGGLEFVRRLSGTTGNNSFYGLALATGDFDADGDDELAVGQPFRNAPGAVIGGEDAGSSSGGVWIHEGGTSGPVPSLSRFFDEADAGAGYGRRLMGTSLAFGQFGSDARRSLAVGCPGTSTAFPSGGQVLDIAPWRQVFRPGCRHALSVDANNNIIYALRPFERAKIASTTKIMTVLLACEATERPLNDPLRVTLDEKYEIENWLLLQFYGGNGGTKWGFEPGSRYRFEDLMRTCVVASGNDSSYAIADVMTGEASSWNGYTATVPQFVALMNARAAEIGMNDTHFTNPAGLDSGDPYSTAWDMWRLARTAMGHPLFRQIVGTEEYVVNYELQNNGTFQPAQRNGNYGWLMGLKAQDARVVGVKPGGTGGAGKTCVVSGAKPAQPDALAYGVGLGWFDPYKGESQRARVEIMQLGLDGSITGPVPKFAKALFDSAWILSNPAQPQRAQGTLEMAAEGQRALPVLFHFVKPPDSTSPPPLDIKLSQDILFDLPDGGATSLEMSGLAGHQGFLVRNVGEASAPVVVDAGGSTRVVLAPGQAHAIPAAAGALAIGLTADGAPALLTLSGICDLTPRWANGAAAPPATTRLELPLFGVHHSWDLTAAPLSSLPSPFPMRVIVEEPFNGLEFQRVPDLDDFALLPSGLTNRITLEFHGIPGLEPADGYDVLSSSSFGSDWQVLERVPPAGNGEGRYRWTKSLPAQTRQFFSIRPAGP